MKRLTTIALFAAAVVLAGCGKKDEKKPATTTAAPAAGTAAPAGGTAVAPAGGTAPVAPAGGTAVAPAGTEAPVAPAAGGAALSDAEFETMMGKAVTMFDSMGKAVDGAGDDCGKLADGLNKVLDDNKEFLETAKKHQDNPDMKKKGEEWMKGHMDQIMGPMMKVGTAGQKCATDPKFAEFQKRFDEMN